MSYFSRAVVALAIAGSLAVVLAGTAAADPTTNCMTATVCAPVNVTGPLLGGVLPTLPVVPVLGH